MVALNYEIGFQSRDLFEDRRSLNDSYREENRLELRREIVGDGYRNGEGARGRYSVKGIYDGAVNLGSGDYSELSGASPPVGGGGATVY